MADSRENEESASSEVESFRNQCSHYSRACSFVSPCCGKVYPCRLCHDDKELSHQIDRHAVKEIICRKCNTRQPVCGECVECGVRFGRYFCSICRLYDDSDKGQFHCDKCGLCRVGGKDNFYHCDTCGLCLSMAMKDLHTCRQEVSKNNCPVCMEDIHTSRTAAHVPKCGHLLHRPCYEEMLKKGLYQCPQCQTSLGDMSSHWQFMDREKEAWQLPQHLLEFKVKINCRDCHKESETNFHVVGYKCSGCGSYNTVRSGDEELPVDETTVIRRVRQREGDQDGESDSSSANETSDSSSSDNDEDDPNDRPQDGPDRAHHHGNQQPNTEDRSHHHGGSEDHYDNGPSGDAPGNQATDDGDVDDASYDGDESDYSEDNSSNGAEFFDCVSRFNQIIPLSRTTRRWKKRPIRSQTTASPEWWETDGESSDSHTHACNHGNSGRSRKPHPPVQVVVEQFEVMEIWGSDYFTDSYSEVSSFSSCEEEVTVTPHSRQPGLKKGPCTHEGVRNYPLNYRGKSQSPPQSLTKLYTETPSLTYPIQNGLNHQSSCDYSYPQTRCSVSEQVSAMKQNASAIAQLRRTDLLSVKDPRTVPSWTRKSSSEESWITANEEWELGTLV